MPILGIHRNALDFDVIDQMFDPKTLTVLDKSIYMDKHQEKPVLEILMPGSSKPILTPFNPYSYTVVNSRMLNLGDGNMPDGVYKLTYRICPQEQLFISKYFLKTDIIELGIDQLLLRVFSSDDVDKNLKSRIETVSLLIMSAKAHAREGNVIEASNLYKRAQKELNKTNCKS